jgi:hypothetical protein
MEKELFEVLSNLVTATENYNAANPREATEEELKDPTLIAYHEAFDKAKEVVREKFS